MVDGTKKRKRVATDYSVHDAINMLVAVLRDAGYSMEFDGLTLKYHIDIGIMVKLKMQDMPDFPVGTTWLQDGTGYDWLVYTIAFVDGVHEVVFIIEEEI